LRHESYVDMRIQLEIVEYSWQICWSASANMVGLRGIEPHWDGFAQRQMSIIYNVVCKDYIPLHYALNQMLEPLAPRGWYIGSHVARIYQTRHSKQVATNPDTSLKTSAAYLIYYCSDTFSIRLY